MNICYYQQKPPQQQIFYVQQFQRQGSTRQLQPQIANQVRSQSSQHVRSTSVNKPIQFKDVKQQQQAQQQLQVILNGNSQKNVLPNQISQQSYNPGYQFQQLVQPQQQLVYGTYQMSQQAQQQQQQQQQQNNKNSAAQPPKIPMNQVMQQQQNKQQENGKQNQKFLKSYSTKQIGSSNQQQQSTKSEQVQFFQKKPVESLSFLKSKENLQQMDKKQEKKVVPNKTLNLPDSNIKHKQNVKHLEQLINGCLNRTSQTIENLKVTNSKTMILKNQQLNTSNNYQKISNPTKENPLQTTFFDSNNKQDNNIIENNAAFSQPFQFSTTQEIKSISKQLCLAEDNQINVNEFNMKEQVQSKNKITNNHLLKKNNESSISYKIFQDEKNQILYKGECRNNEYNGKGILFNNNLVTDGKNETIIKDDISNNWKKYIGTFKDGKPHGSGTLYLKNGNIIQSDSFCMGVIKGNAKIYELNRKCQTLECGNGIFII